MGSESERRPGLIFDNAHPFRVQLVVLLLVELRGCLGCGTELHHWWWYHWHNVRNRRRPTAGSSFLRKLCKYGLAVLVYEMLVIMADDKKCRW